MGYVSCIEDNCEKFDEALNDLYTALHIEDSLNRFNVSEFEKKLENLREKLDEIIDISTDPRYVKAISISDLQVENKVLEMENRKLKSKIRQKEIEYRNLSMKCLDLEQEVKQLNKDLIELSKQLSAETAINQKITSLYYEQLNKCADSCKKSSAG
jgi:DNA repair exonuclease SbcCD ATPase subunit